jgi:hypothetical protein
MMNMKKPEGAGTPTGLLIKYRTIVIIIEYPTLFKVLPCKEYLIIHST